MNNTRPDSLALVQFIHPGKEQTRIREGWCEWGKTKDPHCRKFLLNEASYIRRDDSKSNGIVGFWGEWEGPSHAKRLPEIGNNGPRYCHIPAYYKPESHEGLWDTDPFVFGERFLYNGCQQYVGHHRDGGPHETFLRRLAVGSVILFGSAIQRRFVLDTALVVGDYIDYPRGRYDVLADFVSEEYYSLSLHTQTLIEPTVETFRLYRGATYDERVGGMFSFTPCRAAKDGYVGFERPNIVIPEFVTQQLTQGKKRTVIDDLDAMRKLWLEVRRQVEDAGCLLAHNVALNPKRVRR